MWARRAQPAATRDVTKYLPVITSERLSSISMRSTSLVVAVVCVVVAACGGNSSAPPDASGPDAPPPALCGDTKVEGAEQCDDGDEIKDAVCTAECQFTCGNGALDGDVGETCDTAIATGTEACPATCDDGDACTTDVLSGSECTTACLYSAITAPADDDGCCPAGADANSDNDCTAMCGNGVVEAGELCDTGITAGAGMCPMACNDGNACTTDTLMSANTCQATCTATAITMPANGDGCCPAGANANNDNDCSPTCGNGAVESNETCDTMIASGPGACPTTCSDGMACTTDVLSNAATCTAACSYPAITMPINNDGCCPPGANANNDNNCAPVCGNNVVEMGEMCDDGNMNNTDACANNCTPNIVPTAFRFQTLSLRDPHAFASVIGCNDITDSFFGQAVNQQLATNMNNDGDMDGFLDLSPTLVFRPLTQGGTATSPLEINFANCTPPVGSTSCSAGSDPPILVTATNQTTGTCLGILTGTVRPYSPAVTTTSAPCFASNAATVSFNLAGVQITLQDARVAATYAGNPATSMVNGLLRGFISEADADATIFPAGLAVVGGKPLSQFLRGGTGSCATGSDKDTHNGVVGWWFYLNFTAPRATWTGP